MEEVRGVFARELVVMGKAALRNENMDETRIMRWISSKFVNTRTPKGPVHGKTTVYHGTNKQKRKQRYAVEQSLYRKDIGAAARGVLKDNDLIPTEIPPTRHMFEYWRDVFATGGGSPYTRTIEAPSKPHMNPIWGPMTLNEIKSARMEQVQVLVVQPVLVL